MTEYQRQRKLLRDYLSRQRRKGIQIKQTLPKIVKNPTEKSIKALENARERAKQQARVQREKVKRQNKLITDSTKTKQVTPNEAQFQVDLTETWQPEFIEEYSEDFYDDFPEPEEEDDGKPYAVYQDDDSTVVTDKKTGDVVYARINEKYMPKDSSILDHILDSYVYSLTNQGNFSPNKAALNAFFDKLVEQYGKDVVAQAIWDASKAGVQITREVLYLPEDCRDYMDNILDYIEEAGEITKQEYMDLFGDVEYWNTQEDMELFYEKYK